MVHRGSPATCLETSIEPLSVSPLADTPVDELARLPFHLFRLSLHVCVYICARCAPGFGISFPSDARCPLWPFFLLSLSFFLSEANVCPSQARRKREAFSTRRNPLIIQGKRQADPTPRRATLSTALDTLGSRGRPEAVPRASSVYFRRFPEETAACLHA